MTRQPNSESIASTLKAMTIACALLVTTIIGGPLHGCRSTTATTTSTSSDTDGRVAASFVGPDGKELLPDSPIAAARFRYEQRLSEDGMIPPGALMNAKRQRDALLENNRLLDGGGLSPASWEWLGPGNIGGRIRAILIHPTDPDIMWIGSASGGIWKTTDAGASWRPLDDFLPSLSIGCMAMDPVNPDVLYAGTGEGFFDTIEGSSNTAAVRGAGIFRSIDGGEIWEQMPSTAGPEWSFVNRLAIDPNDRRIIVAATGSGIYWSEDAGQSWSHTLKINALDVKMDPNDSSRLVAGGDHHNWGPYYSTDGGRTWSIASGLSEVDRVELAYAPSATELVLATVSDNNQISLWISSDAGQTYIRRSSVGGTYSAYNNTIWVDPTDEQLVIVGGVFLHRSINGGQSFSSAFSSVHADHHTIVNHPNYDGSSNRTIFFGCDGGIYRADDARGSSAIELNNNLGITQFYGAAINDESGTVLGGTQDNGTLQFTGDSETWSHMFGGDGGYAASDPGDPNYFYGEVQRASIFRSSNGGRSGNYIYSGILDAGSLRTNFIPFFMLDPNESNRMLVGCRSLWRSDNVKTAQQPGWTAIKPPIEGGAPYRGERSSHFAENDPRNISTIAVAEGNSDVVFVGHNNGEVWYTTNGTAAEPVWTRIDHVGAEPLPDRWVSTIVLDPHHPGRVYVALMGWEPDNLWYSDAPFDEWTRVRGTPRLALPSAPISALALHPTRPGWIYVGTDIGVFTSIDAGRTWTVTTDGPAAVPVEQLIWRNDRQLMAVTHGRGIYLATIEFDLTLAGPSPGIAGELNELTVSGAQPGARVVFAYSFTPGSTPIPDCPGLASDLDQPIAFGSAFADANGNATVSRVVPLAARGRIVHFQAAETDDCRLTQPISHRFE